MLVLNETWRKASRSNNNGACVEVRAINNKVQLRDTKDKGLGPILSFTFEEWVAFCDGAAKGEFNL